MEINDIKITKPFLGLFPFDRKVYEAVLKDMKKNGYDYAHPVIVWEEQQILIDGHCRTMAAQELKMDGVPASLKHFENEEEALEYAIHVQRDRRNLTDADILSCIQAVDKRKKSGERTDLGSSEPRSSEPDLGRSAEKTAETVGTSPTKVKKSRTVLDHADEETKQEVLAGTKSIHKAYTETQKKRKPPPKTDSKPTQEEPQKKPGISQGLQNVFDITREGIKTAIEEGWKTNSKEAVIQYLNSLIALVRKGK